ncbi:MAG: AAA family ATPase [Thermoguttaceae bacterium]|nr:AAA family ATPase [Thermoguttaceae bacterium]
MSTIIKKIKLINFKRFKNYSIEPNDRINILVGDNETGKSSVLEAIDLVSSGSVRRVETIGLDRLINIDSVRDVARGVKSFDELPILRIELYLELEKPDQFMNGKNNTDRVNSDGIRLVCAPNPEYRAELTEVLTNHKDFFPYDYYSIHFSTFAGEGYAGYKRKLRVALIDSVAMSHSYATNEFVRRMYLQYAESNERIQHKGAYRLLRNNYRTRILEKLNERVPADKNYAFGLKTCGALGLEDDLMIYEDDIGIDCKGTGRQVFIKTDFAIERAGDNVDIILIEEPENHLSPVNLRKLIQRVAETQKGQIFVTTHNSLISTRLELQNLLLLHANCDGMPTTLKTLSEDTSKYFMKTPPASIVEFALTQKALLVEGPSEFMLIEQFYKSVSGHVPEDENVHVIDIRGLSFQRYLEVARQTGSRVAVITDNDGEFQKNCIDKYTDYTNESNIHIFFDSDNEKRTFETVLYTENSALCDGLFGSNALNYMLNNKTEAAYRLLSQNQKIVTPDYIKRAIEWIRE